MEVKQFYRYEAVEYATTDYDGEFVSPSTPHPKLELHTYSALKETPKGYWIGWRNSDYWKKWVSKTAKKRFAYPTKEEALENFIQRKRRQIEILEWQLESAKYALRSAEYQKEHKTDKLPITVV